MLCAFAGLIFTADSNLGRTLRTRITLPIEIMGAEGSVAAVSVDLPQASASQVSSLWLQMHGLEYPDLASVRVNAGRGFL